MNTVMAHVTNSADVQIGDEVVLFGKQAAAEITQREIAQVTVVGAECSRLMLRVSDGRQPRLTSDSCLSWTAASRSLHPAG